MITLISTLLSFLAGGLPQLMSFFKDRSDKAHELQILQMQNERDLELRKAGLASQQKIEEIRTEQINIQAHQSSIAEMYKHDVEIGKGASRWIINLRASVRPVITYGMFLLLCFVNAWGAYYAVQTGVEFQDALMMLWNEDTQIIWSSIIAFWFGSQAFSKR